MISVLSIDNDVDFSLLLSIYMQSEGGFVLTTVEEGQAGCDLLADQGFDVILLDSELPGISGFEILRSIRRSGDDTPVIVFTARGDNLERYHAIRDQADIYLPKSCRLPELTECVRRLHHDRYTAPPEPGEGTRIPGQNLTLDTTRQRAHYRGHSILLTPEEYRVLTTLASHSGQVVNRSAIDEAFTTTLSSSSQRSIEDCIGNLRKKLGPGADGRQLIRAVGQLGYTLQL